MLSPGLSVRTVHFVCVSFVWFWGKTAVISLNIFNKLIFVMEKCCFEARTKILNIIYTSFDFKGLRRVCRTKRDEDGCFLGYCTVNSCRNWPTFQRCLLHPSPSLSAPEDILVIDNCWRVGFQKTNSLKMIAFCDISPCSLVELERRFRGAYCLHHLSTMSQKAVIFILAAVRTWNVT
jgi:hypothetical protein